MLREELAREAGPEAPVKYHGKWPFVRIFSLQVGSMTTFFLITGAYGSGTSLFIPFAVYDLSFSLVQVLCYEVASYPGFDESDLQ